MENTDDATKKENNLTLKTTFELKNGGTVEYYIENNPWKLSRMNNVQRVFRYCIVCGKNRYSDDDWNNGRLSIRQSIVSCDFEPSCETRNFYETVVNICGTADKNEINDSEWERLQKEESFVVV